MIAAVNGVCMGGGLELALGCSYRIATADATLGLPEVKIGLLPGAGGTQRLPRAVGAEKSLRMIVSGDPISGNEALAAGLVERVVSRDSFDGVLKFAAEVAGRGAHPRLRDITAALPAGVSVENLFGAARAEVAKQARGLPAPSRCVDAVEAAVILPFDEGLARERSFFIELVQSAESKALRHAFADAPRQDS